MDSEFIRAKEFAKTLGISRPTLWRLWRIYKRIPAPRQLAPRCVGWPIDEVKRVIAELQTVS